MSTTVTLNVSDQQLQLFKDRSTPVRDRIAANLTAVEQAAHARAEVVGKELDGAIARSSIVGLVLGLLAIVLTIGAAMAITRSVARPISVIAKALGDLVKGNRHTDVPYKDRSDEVGEVAKAALAFKESLLQTDALQEQEQANVQRQQALAAEMAEIVREVGEVVDAAASGDFTRRAMAKSSQAELAKLVDGINEINAVVDRATASSPKSWAASRMATSPGPSRRPIPAASAS